MPKPVVPFAIRFKQRLSAPDQNGCILYGGYLDTGFGYGKIKQDTRKGKLLYAHRLSWEIFRGPIPPKLCVLHKCDNPACVNPDHLFLGTHADNMADMVAKGRHRRANAKLTPETVRLVRQSTLSNRLTGIKFGVSATLVSLVRNRHIWRGV